MPSLNLFKLWASILCITLLLGTFFIYFSAPPEGNPQMYAYYHQHAIADTGANNQVTAIYLVYRVFDTLFEALLLMMSVTAIHYFLEAWQTTPSKEDEHEL